MLDSKPASLSSRSFHDVAALVLNHTADYVVVVTDPAGVILFWNSSAESVLGWSAQEAIGQLTDIFFHPRDCIEGQPAKERQEAVDRGRALDERWHVRQDGSLFWASGELVPLYEESVLLGYVKILRDRTQERLLEERLRLVEKVGLIGSFELFPSQGLMTVSPEFCQLLGIPTVQMYSIARILERIHPEDRIHLFTDRNELPENALDYIEYRIYRADTGEERWIARRGEIVHNDPVDTVRYLGVCYDITDRKHAELKTQEAKVRWHELFESIHEGFFVAEAIRNPQGEMEDFCFLEANPAFWKQLNLESSAKVLNRSAREVIPGIQDELIKAYARLLDKGEPTHTEIYVPALGHRWFEARARRISAERFAVLFMDISKRKQIEAALAESEARFRAITHSIEQIVWAAQPDGWHDFFNQRWYDYTGLAPGTCNGHQWLHQIHPDDEEHVRAVWQNSLVSGAPYRLEFRLRNALGQYRWFLATAHPVRDEQQRIKQWFGTSTDIQDIVDAREVLSRSREVLEERVEESAQERNRIWNLSYDMMSVTRADGRIVEVNRACTETLGWSEAELLAFNWIDMVHPEDWSRAVEELSRLRSGENTPGYETRFRCKDGSYRFTSWTAFSDKGHIYAVGRDITLLRQTEEQLRQSQKMEAVGQLTGGIAHDFNNLLMGIIGNLDLLQRRYEAGHIQGLDRYLGAAVTSAQRAAALTQRLLAFSRRQSLDLKPVDINALVVSLEDLLRRTLGPTIRLNTELEVGLPTTLADANQLESVLLNLVINARDAMPAGGTLSLSTFPLESTSRQYKMLNSPEGDYLTVCVKDTGIGMSQEIMAKVFEPFFTTKPIGQGTGLGLSMVYGYIKQVKGHIHISSEPGQGTCVCLYLSCNAGGSIDHNTYSSVGMGKETRQGSGEVILVVEDESVVRSLVVEVLLELGYVAFEAFDATEAIPLLQSNQRIDLMISDVGLPGMNGRQLADLARQHRPSLKVLFATGYAEGSGERGYLDKDMEIITKPFAIDALASKVKEMLSS